MESIDTQISRMTHRLTEIAFWFITPASQRGRRNFYSLRQIVRSRLFLPPLGLGRIAVRALTRRRNHNPNCKQYRRVLGRWHLSSQRRQILSACPVRKRNEGRRGTRMRGNRVSSCTRTYSKRRVFVALAQHRTVAENDSILGACLQPDAPIEHRTQNVRSAHVVFIVS